MPCLMSCHQQNMYFLRLLLCNGNVSVDGKVVYMPIYMLMFLEKKQAVNVTYKLDLSDL